MEIGDKESKLLVDLFNKCHEQKKWVSAGEFSDEHADDIETIESLKRKNLIHWDAAKDTYHIKFRAFLLVENKLFNETLYAIERVFYKLKDSYIVERGRDVAIDDV